MSVEIMRAIRRMSNLDQEQFADKIGVSLSLLGKIEIGNAPLTKRTVSKIVHAFGLTEQDIVDLENMVEYLKKDK